ncbi:MAG: HAD family hydrolase, partial [Clostridia bacterium]|nr:HAD family hydrolase [Clostridia bacterium]
MYKAVIFDLDGTLIDSLGDILEVLNQTLRRFGLTEVTRVQATEYIGNGARELVRLAIGGENASRLDEILAYYKKAYAACNNRFSTLYGGEKEALTAVRQSGAKLAILTNKPHAVALKTNEQFFKEFRFDLVQGQEDGAPQKPDPLAALSVAERLGVDVRECVIVGDGETDYFTARNSGADCVSVLWGYRSREQLSA